MSFPASRHMSPWVDTMPVPELGPIRSRDDTSDVLVLGGGITGITSALLLQRAGLKVTVVEARRLFGSVTTHSTVKVTYGHGTLYSKIEQKSGLDAAAVYADANVAGFQQLLDLARGLNIDCMLEVGHPHVIYAERSEDVHAVEAEARVAERIGLPVTLSPHAPVPFDVAAAVHFPDQAYFHPGHYLAGLAEAFVREGGNIIEGVRARDVNEDNGTCTVDTTAGELTAAHVVVATHYPFLDRGGQFSRMKATRSYGIAGVLPEGVKAGMAINVGSPTRSTRTATLNGEELLIVVGEGHDVGHISDTEQCWARLQQWAQERYGLTEFRYHWSAEETSTLDHLPFVGFATPRSNRVLLATGFAGWGMTNGTAAAMLMRDLVVGQHNSWASTFDARRAETTLPGKEFVKHNLHIGKTWLKDRVGGSPEGETEELKPGDAAVLEVDGEQTATYRDEQGVLHQVSAVCTHMGCTVGWNNGERSWDCPCHGSRFDPDGQVLHGPASNPLPKRSSR